MKSIIISFLAAAYATPIKVLDLDFPDPAVIQTDRGYYAFGTQSNDAHVPVAWSGDFTTWTLLEGTDALPGPYPSWVQGDNPQVWAPDVIQRDDGAYVMYYSGLSREDNNKHCFGAATSSSIEGPYTSEDEALACPLDKGGAIDASGFRDEDGTRYVVYKVDGSALNGDGTIHPTPIMLQRLGSDAVTPDGDPVQILDRDDGDGPLIEAPSLLKVDGTYYLSFSSGMFDTLAYDVSFATASSITGPYTKARDPDAPLLVTGDESNVGPLAGPGGADFLDDGKKMAFHAFNDGQGLDGGRGVWVVDISVADGKITLL
ncbi:glycosyl hydrolase [Aspergillus californicus]